MKRFGARSPGGRSRVCCQPRRRPRRRIAVAGLMKDVLLMLTGYVLGSLPWGYWLPRLLSGVDIRTVGSQSTGAANVWRALGFKIALGVAVLDIGKGFAAARLGTWPGGELGGRRAVSGAPFGR